MKGSRAKWVHCNTVCQVGDATDSNSFLELYDFDFSNTYEQGFDLQWFHASKDLILSSYSDVKIDTKNMHRRNH